MKGGEPGKRPVFPKRAVVTGGMPYGSKKLHFGHVCGMYIHADIYARFLRDRIGGENVIFVSGTDCYGAGIEVKYAAAVQNGFAGTIEDFIEANHLAQKETLNQYGISLDLFAASGLGEAKDIHAEVSRELFNAFHERGYLQLDEALQFYDEETQTFLNGRQVEGRCPIAGCKSEKGYADECSLGHQYSPSELIAPVAVTTGKTPSLKAVRNWYFDLARFSGALKQRQRKLRDEGISRRFMLSTIDDFLKDAEILIKTEDFETLSKARETMPAHRADINEEKKSAVLTFSALKDRERACEILRACGIRFRTGTTLVPFRLSGNVKWGVPVPEKEGISGQTFWVWPESLWAPISFIKTFLKQKGSGDAWEKWWFDSDARVYQFIGEDNIYFYAIAEMGLFMALDEISNRAPGGNFPATVPNRHVFYGKNKASSSGAVKPPDAEALLNFYTVEQLRMHFAHMALQSNSVSFTPKTMLAAESGEGKNPKEFDATLAEGNILTNVYNRIVRSCFYTLQKYFGGKLPEAEISADAVKTSETLITEYECAMYRFEFSKAIDLLDVYLRDVNKDWAAKSKEAESSGDESLRGRILADTFHAVRVAALLLHPFAPQGTETVREYLGVDERLWDWEYAYEPLTFFMKGGHTFKFLEPRVDFFSKHPAQL
ncbi:MAG: class I tRNA ligase family protein [Clostridiales bacterium]|nr:class I tRNA ligase family protein [Clostridiales bacterium]